MKPATEAELAEIIRAARGGLCLQGGGTRRMGSGSGETLDLSDLTGISLYEPGALTLVAGAGTPLAEVEQVLAAEGQRLSFEVPDWRALLGRGGVSTIGGVVAANASGPRRVQAGACRDSLIGLRFVDGSGQVIRNGGRVMKNVTGYDLVKLLAGSCGTLGALTEVAFKVLPIPETEATLALEVADDKAAVTVMAAALRSPFEVTGAGFIPQAGRLGGKVLLRIEGFEKSVSYRAERLAQALSAHGVSEIHLAMASAGLWRQIRDVKAFRDHDFVARLSLRPSSAPEVLETIRGSQPAEYMLDWGGGLIWIGSSVENAAERLTMLQGLMARQGGHATLVKGPDALFANGGGFQPEISAIAALTRGLRARFDPRGILNPGLMG
ncbi:MAG: FAD-binding protein [Pseudorhodobacter sp.]